jgi:hypothetical protein
VHPSDYQVKMRAHRTPVIHNNYDY